MGSIASNRREVFRAREEENGGLAGVVPPRCGKTLWEDAVFTITALRETQERAIVCLDRRTGQIRWLRSVIQSRFEAKHSLNSHASNTPAPDGELVYES